jgi:hypothetical protein
MTQQPFTPAGVQQMQAELNQLSPSDLQTQVNLIQSDLRSWVSDNFTLDSDQQTYLQQIDDSFMNYAGNLTGFAVANKLTISLTVKPNNPPKPLKLIHIKDDIEAIDSADGFSVTGNLYYTVDYQ